MDNINSSLVSDISLENSPNEIQHIMLDNKEHIPEEEEIEPVAPQLSMFQSMIAILKNMTIGQKQLGIHYLEGKSGFAIPLDYCLTFVTFSILGGVVWYLGGKVNTRVSVEVSYIPSI